MYRLKENARAYVLEANWPIAPIGEDRVVIDIVQAGSTQVMFHFSPDDPDTVNYLIAVLDEVMTNDSDGEQLRADLLNAVAAKCEPFEENDVAICSAVTELRTNAACVDAGGGGKCDYTSNTDFEETAVVNELFGDVVDYNKRENSNAPLPPQTSVEEEEDDFPVAVIVIIAVVATLLFCCLAVYFCPGHFCDQLRNKLGFGRGSGDIDTKGGQPSAVVIER
jgi:hypothetical protein